MTPAAIPNSLMPTPTNEPLLTPRFENALAFASQVHAHDLRKGGSIPYVAHLLGVCAMVLVDGGNEDEAIAALLHDTLEDHPEDVSRDDIQTRFGSQVLRLVEGCTDTPADFVGGAKPPWRERKLAYLQHLREAGLDGYRVSLADKVDNARAILSDYHDLGDDLWSRFNAGRDEQLWYYRSIVTTFHEVGVRGRLVDELDAIVSELETLASQTAKPGAV